MRSRIIRKVKDEITFITVSILFFFVILIGCSILLSDNVHSNEEQIVQEEGNILIKTASEVGK